MSNRGYHIRGDLKRAMRQEAREEQRAEAEAAWYDAVAEIDDYDELHEKALELAEEQSDIDREIADLRRQIETLEQRREKAESRQRFVEKRMYEVDPEVVVQVVAHNTRRRGWQLGITVEKCPPLPDRTNEDDGPTLMNRPVTETISETIDRFTDYIAPDEHEDGEVIATLTFEDMEDDRPDVEWNAAE